MSGKIDFESLYIKYHRKIIILCRGYTNDNAIAEDLAQETFIKVWKNLDAYRSEATISTWIYRIAVNTCLSFIRSELGKKRILPLLPEIENNGESNLSQTQEINELYRCINKLNDLDRLVITMVLEEVPYPEIADILNMSPGNLRVKIHRIKNELTKIYNHE